MSLVFGTGFDRGVGMFYERGGRCVWACSRGRCGEWGGRAGWV